MPDRAESAAAPARSGAVRMFGRFQLLRLIGKSERSMLWLAADPRGSDEVMLAMPRSQPADADGAQLWQARVRRAARLSHPNLASLVEAGEHDRWPYAAYDRGLGVPLSETLSSKGLEPGDVARWAAMAMQGLAFAHDAGFAHGDVQPFHCALDEQGVPRWLGLGVASAAAAEAQSEHGEAPSERQAQRDSSQRDVLAFGLLLHHALVGQPALDEPDTGRAIDRLPPVGRETVRLPWSVPRPIPDPLRAIVNRATDRQARQRYRSARTLQRALEGWLQTGAAQGGGPLALLLDRLRTVGLLPALPGAAERAARLALMERQRTSDMAAVVIEDPALAFEMLRAVNSGELGSALGAGNGPVLTIRRAIAMIGVDGVRRAALALRAWPGPMAPDAADELQRLIARCKRAGAIARLIKPAGYDDEVVFLIALLQNIGRLVVRYHFPDEAGQIERLMQPAASPEPDKPDEPGMTPEAAAYAVLGVDIDDIGAAVARHAGFGDATRQMMRRLPLAAPVRAGDDDDMLRAVGSCANEIVDALSSASTGAASKIGEAFGRIAARYARVLGIAVGDIVDAVKASAPSARSACAAATPGASGSVEHAAGSIAAS